MKAIFCCIAAVALAGAVCSPAAARTEEETWNRCLRLDKIEPPSPEDIIEACRAVLKMDDIAPDIRNGAFNNIGVAYMQLGKYDEAIKAFSEALIKLRDLPDGREVRLFGKQTRSNRAKAYIATKRYADALRDYDTMASLESEPESHSERCLMHALYEDTFVNALFDCQKAIEANKNASAAVTGWLVVEYRQGKYQDVKADCALVREKASLPLEAAYVCALADRRLGSTVADPTLLQLGLKILEHGERFRELGMVP